MELRESEQKMCVCVCVCVCHGIEKRTENALAVSVAAVVLPRAPPPVRVAVSVIEY